MDVWMAKKNKLFSKDCLLPVIPFGLESLDIFGESIEKAEIEPVGRPEDVLVDLKFSHVLGSHIDVLLGLSEMDDRLVNSCGCGSGWGQARTVEG
jgi:hypothetical protein